MATFDVRDESKEEITEIVFAEVVAECDAETAIAYKVIKGIFNYIEDMHDGVRIESKEHAQNLIKALNKAIELGWLK